MIYRDGRLTRGFALGEGGSDPFTQAASDLADLQGAVKQGDALAASGDSAGAIRTYRTAGANAVAVLGPEIEEAGGSKERTQHAKTLNETLNTSLDAPHAREVIGAMLDDYLTAIRDGRSKADVSPEKHMIWPIITIPLGMLGIIGGIMRIKKHARRRK